MRLHQCLQPNDVRAHAAIMLQAGTRAIRGRTHPLRMLSSPHAVRIQGQAIKESAHDCAHTATVSMRTHQQALFSPRSEEVCTAACRARRRRILQRSAWKDAVYGGQMQMHGGQSVRQSTSCNPTQHTRGARRSLCNLEKSARTHAVVQVIESCVCE
jgi:hypothetical protein